MLIYKIRNIVNNKIYIGKTVNLRNRLTKHKQHLKKDIHCNKHLQASWNKYGEENFEFTIVEYCNSENIDQREIYWISYYKSNNDLFGYNLTLGGEGGTPVEKIRKKQSNSKDSKKLKVYGFTRNGLLIKEWCSIKDCARELKVNPCDVRRTISLKQITCKGYILNNSNIFRTRENLTKYNYKNFNL